MKKSSEAIQRWKEENITRFTLCVRKGSHIMDRLALAVESGLARSRQAYVLSAIEAALDRDGVPVPGKEPASNPPSQAPTSNLPSHEPTSNPPSQGG